MKTIVHIMKIKIYRVNHKNKVEAVNLSFDKYLSPSVSSSILLYDTNHIEVSKIIRNITRNTINKIGS